MKVSSIYIVDFSGNVPRAISLKDSISMSAITGDSGDLIASFLSVCVRT